MNAPAVEPIALAGPGARFERFANPILQSLLAVLLAFAICSGILALTGFSPVDAWRELIERTLLRPSGLQETVVRATPLLIAGMAVLIAARTGLWNIGIDGQVLTGALAAAVAGHALAGNPAVVVWIGALLAGALVGAAWAAVPALLRARWDINEIVTTIMFNYLAISLTSWLVKGPLRDESLVTPQTPLIPRELRFSHLGDTRIHIGIVLALAIVAIGGWWFRSTVGGFEMRAVGEGSRAARHAMIPVRAIVVAALVASGAVAALAGANDVLATKGTFQGEWNPEYGLSAFALVFLARRNVVALLPAALFLGMLSYGADVMPRAAGVPSVFFPLFEGVLLIVLAAMHWQPWRRGR
jgi:ABC-type uncharacterized transport system permease subunit